MQAMSKMSARVVSQTSNKRFIIPLELFFYVFKQLYFWLEHKKRQLSHLHTVSVSFICATKQKANKIRFI